MLYWICLFLILIPLVVEKFLLKKWRATVPVLIHVHGTRGKSTITRNIAEILRSQGLRVLAKTTGDTPEYILPDGKIIPLRRFSPPRIQEHVAILRKAANMKVNIVVVEGMALTPETIAKSEEILSATHAVIANTRPDHAESMGKTKDDVIQTLSLMIPKNGQLFTAEEKGAKDIYMRAYAQGVPCNIVVCPSPIHQSASIAQAVTNNIFKEKISNAEYKNTSLSPTISCKLDIACLNPTITEKHILPVYCYDFFSVNDVESSQLLCAAIAPLNENNIFTVALLATCADRPLRTQTFLEWVLKDTCFDFVTVVGNHRYFSYFYSLFHKTKNTTQRPFSIRQFPFPAHLMEAFVKRAQKQGKDSLRIICLGNTHGYGEIWRNFIKEHHQNSDKAE